MKSDFLVVFCCESSAGARNCETFLILFGPDTFSDGPEGTVEFCEGHNSFQLEIPAQNRWSLHGFCRFYILSLRGDTIITRDFRGDVVKGTAEIFFRKVSW